MRLQPDASAVHLIEHYLKDALHKNASDIHCEPAETLFRIRYRMDGLLREIDTLALPLAHRLMARLKILANLDISEKRLPQDGRFHFHTPPLPAIECRISTCPTLHGEKIVLRLHPKNAFTFDIHALGFNDLQKTHFLQAIQKPQGLILVTGPTGSGKSQTLYHALHHLNTPLVNICTIEDPIEIHLQGMNQVNIHPKVGLHFTTALRAFLRQDPDIIMIGEIRDNDTANIAINAAQTGHLVLATLHANSAIEAFKRLTHMGVANYYLANTIILTMAQRLIRKCCTHCLATAPDCPHCFEGYAGRTGIFEVLPMTSCFREGLLNNLSLTKLTQLAVKEGMLPLYEAGLEKVSAGLSTLEEILRVVGGS